jgi:hypothetical protein
MLKDTVNYPFVGDVTDHFRLGRTAFYRYFPPESHPGTPESALNRRPWPCRFTYLCVKEPIFMESGSRAFWVLRAAQYFDALDLIERNLIPDAIIKLRSTGRLMRSDCCACSRVPPFGRYAVIPVARKVWQQVE